jgi:hypothetical protein
VITGSKSKQCTSNLNNVRREDKHSRNKNKEYLIAKINEFGTNSNIKNTRDLCRATVILRRVNQPRTNREKDEKGDLVTALNSILNR